MSEAASISVFIVLIVSLGDVVTVGACFRDEDKANAEARRYEAANSYNKSIVIVRQLG